MKSKGNIVTRAQSGGVSKGMPSTGKSMGGKSSDGLKTAWMGPEKRGKAIDMPAAKKKVR